MYTNREIFFVVLVKRKYCDLHSSEEKNIKELDNYNSAQMIL